MYVRGLNDNPEYFRVTAAIHSTQHVAHYSMLFRVNEV